MTLQIQNIRRIEKRTFSPGVVPTLAPSLDHTDGTWPSTAIYSGELFINLADKKLYTSDGASVFELTGAGGGGGTITSWIHRVIDFVASLPGSPITDDRYALTSGPNINQIATWNGVAWLYYVPEIGDVVMSQSETFKIRVWDGGSWTSNPLSPTLTETLLAGNNTGGNHVVFTDGDAIIMMSGAFSVGILPSVLTASRFIEFPDKDGVVALTTDLHDESTWLNSVEDYGTTPPGGPVTGQRELVAVGASGIWVG